MPNIDEMFPSKYLKGTVEFAKSQAFVLPMKEITQDTFDNEGEKETFWVIWFHEWEGKGFRLNQTNAKSVAAIHGPTTENWPGKKIVLFGMIGNTQNGPQMRIFVRAADAPAEAPSPGPTSPDEDPSPTPTSPAESSATGALPSGQPVPSGAPPVVSAPASPAPGNDDDLPF